MLVNNINVTYRYISRVLLGWFLLMSNNTYAAMVEYQANLFGPGMNVHYCVDLDSSGILLGDYNESEGTLSNISGALTYVAITEGFIKKGFNNVKNYVLGTFNDNVPGVLAGYEYLC